MTVKPAVTSEPMWVDSAIFWHVYPLGFTGSQIWEPAQPAPRLRHLLNWLDYLVRLGCNGLLLGPIFTSCTHGYDTVDHFSIDPRLGDLSDFQQLLSACHERGVKVVLDGVFSHVSSDFVRPELIDPQEVFEGHQDLKRLQHDLPETVAYVSSVMDYWLAKGIDGWRLDAAYSIPTKFWQDVIRPIKQQYPHAYFLGEVIHGDYSEIVANAGFDSLTQYELWKAIWSSIKDHNFFELDWTLRRHNDFLDSFLPQTFIGNHDVTRIATQVGPQAAIMAAAILLTVGGVPSLYYGDEIGMEGLKEERFRGDDAIRPAFPDTPDQIEWSPSAEKIFHSYQALIALRRQNPWLVQARTEVLALENQAFTYRAKGNGEGEELTVELRNFSGQDVGVQISRGDQVLWAM